MASLQTTTFNDTGFITLPSGNTASRPGSPSTGMIRYNTSMSLLEWFNGSAWQPITGYSAGTLGTGGQSIFFARNGIVHVFTTVGNHTFTPAFTGNVQVLIVAGGGGGAGSHGGGGGGGGFIFNRTFPVVQGTNYNVTVGAGGDCQGYGPFATNGGNSAFGGTTATGGGGGGPWDQGGNESRSGGSGGGAGSSSQDGSRFVVRGGTGDSNQGFPGGAGRRFNRQGDNAHNSGGGGGAGGPGREGSDHRYEASHPDGGPGAASDITGEILYWAGGGGAGPHLNAGGGGSGGIGGGGGGAAHHGAPTRPPDYSQLRGLGGGLAWNTGQSAPAVTTGGNAGTNTGGGGGGGNAGSGSQLGAPGIVIVRY